MGVHTTQVALHPHRPDLGPAGRPGTAWMRVPYVVHHAPTIPAADLNEYTARLTRNGHDDTDVQDLWAVSGDLLRLFHVKNLRAVGIHCRDCDITATAKETV